MIHHVSLAEHSPVSRGWTASRLRSVARSRGMFPSAGRSRSLWTVHCANAQEAVEPATVRVALPLRNPNPGAP